MYINVLVIEMTNNQGQSADQTASLAPVEYLQASADNCRFKTRTVGPALFLCGVLSVLQISVLSSCVPRPRVICLSDAPIISACAKNPHIAVNLEHRKWKIRTCGVYHPRGSLYSGRKSAQIDGSTI